MKKHFVTFYSPGAFCSEETTRSIESWNPAMAVEMARSIVERHNAKPYGFVFTTRERKDSDLDSKVTERSGTYFLGGDVLTIEDIKARNDPKDAILLSNMRGNCYDRVIENCNSWKFTGPLGENDIVLDVVL